MRTSAFVAIAQTARPIAAQTLREAKAAERASCLHCGQPTDASAPAGYCCRGCRAVHQLLMHNGLDRYYDLRPGTTTPVPLVEKQDGKWLDAIEQDLGAAAGAKSVALDVQGVHCAACVWLIDELFERQGQPGSIVVNPAIGRVELVVDSAFALRDFVNEVERFGYRFGPPLKTAPTKGDELLLRLGICLALAGNSMLFAISTYLGLQSGPVFDLMMQLQYGFAAVSVLVGGSVFIRAALVGLRRRILSLDLPIALGIVLAFVGSSYSYFAGGTAVYFDTVAVFIALMVLGRWLQERVLERNRRQLLESDGVEGLLTSRIENGRPQTVKAVSVASGNELLIAPKDLVPVDVRLLSEGALCSLDWINGESAARTVPMGGSIAAGAFNAGAEAIRVQATEDFETSALTTLLRRPPARSQIHEGRFWNVLPKAYVVVVLVVAALGMIGWIAAGDTMTGLEVAIAVLVVTCPCAFGIATPLAYELAQAGLRKRGLFVRSGSFFDRLGAVRRVIFDKTGTLTLGTLAIRNRSAFEDLTPQQRQVLFDLASRSTHPKSRAIVESLDDSLSLGDLNVTEQLGQGVETEIEGVHYRLGSADFVGQPDKSADVHFVRGDELLAAFDFVEELRPDAPAEVRALRERGLEVSVLSGDAPDRVQKVAAQVGIPFQAAQGALSPAAKASRIKELDAGDTLFIGDGVNDALAADAAYVTGTPAIDRPFMASRSDFYIVTPGLWPVTQALRVSDSLAQTVRLNLGFALVYNVAAVAFAWAGWMEPWMAAVLMPVSSLTTLALTTARLNERSKLWKC